jgi:hypothetical protein
MRRALALLLLATLVVGGSALAARGEPRERFTAQDQARARSMLLRPVDLPGFRPSRPGQESDVYCQALDESDLTLTGKAESPLYGAQVVFVSSFAHIYESVADADASWRRGTSPAGERCIRRELGRDVRLVSFRKRSFPRVAPKTVAYRITGTTQGVEVYVDFIVLQRSRAQAGVVLGAAASPVPADVQTRLARLVAARMAKAMRGAS